MVKNYIWIAIVLVILLQKMHSIQMIRNDGEENSIDHQIRFSFLILEITRNCEYSTPEFSFTFNDCNMYQIGSTVTLFGSPTIETDKHFFGPKRLMIATVVPHRFRKYSVKNWLERCVRLILTLKNRLLRELSAHLPEPHTGLIGGMVFGGSQQLSSKLEDDLRTTGLTHVVSASGYNVSMVLSLAMVFLKKLPRHLGSFVLAILIVAYTLMAGIVPPVLRAATMAMVGLLATRVCFRQYHPGYSLLLVTLGLLIWEPWYLKSLSFWLSVTATAGIVLVLPLVEGSMGWFARLAAGNVAEGSLVEALPSNVSILDMFKEALYTTLAAQSFSAPLVFSVFGELSVLSILTNTLLLWLTPLLTLGGLTYMIISAMLGFFPLLLELWSVLATPFLWFTAEVFLESVTFFGGWEWGVLRMNLPPWAVAGWWVGLLALIYLHQRRVAHDRVAQSGANTARSQ